MLIHRVAMTLAVSGAMALVASAQTPPPTDGQKPPEQNTPLSVAAEHQWKVRRRSIVHHYPYPYPEYYQNDRAGGFRNPGGVGRYLEYYPPGNKFQTNSDPVRAATFDRGGGAPDRAEQIQAQQLGVQKDNAIMNHIDNYARPAFGYGFGAGYFGGFY